MTKDTHLNHTETASVPIFGMDAVVLAFTQWSSGRTQSADHPDVESIVPIPPKPSALRVAVLRAAHQLLDTPLVFEDPLAIVILGADWESFLRSDPTRLDLPRLKGFRASMVLRSRLTEDEWTRARQRGVDQYVILGAGLDTFAYRNQDHVLCRVFEVDLPDMVCWKRECLRFAGIDEPDALTFVPVDFENASVAEALMQAGFDQDTPAFFSWLGVTFYLDEDAIMHTLRFVGSLAPGSEVVFDYAVHPDFLSPEEQQAMERLDKKMAAGEEPWKTHLAPALLHEILHTLGFTDVEEFGPEQINARYLSGRTDGFRKGGLTRLIRARV